MSGPIIRSLLDTDLDKFTMMQAVLHQHPAAQVEYEFRCRTPGIDFAPFIDEIREEISALCTLRMSEDELAYLGRLDFIKPDFIDFLRLFQLDERFLSLDHDGPHLHLALRGPWLHTILFEVPLLAIINEVYFRNHYPHTDHEEGRRRLQDKIALIEAHPDSQGFMFSDYGTRHRLSRKWHHEVVAHLQECVPNNLAGTSNVEIARKLGLCPIGTLSHEYLQAFQALGPRLADSQRAALEAWVHEYRGRLGIALTDVVGMDAFLRDFDLYFAKLFDGICQDSGNPFAWTRKALAHYRRLKINPQTKTLVYSDHLTIAEALDIYEHFKDDSNLAFSIGPHLTNDLGHEPLDTAIQMIRCNNQAVAKITDDHGRIICKDRGYLNYLAKVFQIDPARLH